MAAGIYLKGNIKMEFAIGIDLGGTRIKGVATDAKGNILHKLYIPTNDGDDAIWKNAVAETVNELLKKINVDLHIILTVVFVDFLIDLKP
jgi:predicted NBD/HSP70 family sugar kinase